MKQVEHTADCKQLCHLRVARPQFFIPFFLRIGEDVGQNFIQNWEDGVEGTLVKSRQRGGC